MTDIDIYSKLPVEDLWVYDKLILSKKLGYNCNPAGIPVDRAGWYMVKPITNLRGLGAGSKRMFLTPAKSNIPPGTFWTKFFEGTHRSVDYINHKYAFTVKAFKQDGEFKIWEKDKIEIPLNDITEYFVNKYQYVNIEYIGDKIIEIHLRYNSDFYNRTYKRIEVVYEPSQIKSSFILDEDDADGYAKRRIGFNVL